MFAREFLVVGLQVEVPGAVFAGRAHQRAGQLAQPRVAADVVVVRVRVEDELDLVRGGDGGRIRSLIGPNMSATPVSISTA